jgi:hypothetical protein
MKPLKDDPMKALSVASSYPKEFLEGFFDGDGSIYQGPNGSWTLVFSSCDERMSNLIETVLRGTGFNPIRTAQEVDTKTPDGKTYHVKSHRIGLYKKDEIQKFLNATVTLRGRGIIL